MPTIRKALITGFGDESKVVVVDADIAPPGPNEVQVEVEYSGFAGADVNMRKGVYPMQKKAPLTPGYCFCGRVHENGPGSSRFQPGTQVVCLTVYDAEAEFVNVPEKYLVPVPAGLDAKQVTALVLDWNTAYGMVTRAARVKEGQRVFVHGMSGAVGQAILALCQLQGAQVFGTASPRNHTALVAQRAVPYSYTNKDWITALQHAGGVDAVFDALGFESSSCNTGRTPNFPSDDESYSILRRGGVLVGYGLNLPSLTGGPARSILPSVAKLFARNAALWTGKKTVFYYITRDQKTFVPELNALFELLQAGKISVPIKAVYPLEKVRDAHVGWGKGSGMGSVLIKVKKEAA